MPVPLGYTSQAPQTASSSQGGPRQAPSQAMPRSILKPLGTVAGNQPGGTILNPIVQSMLAYRGG